jgi:uncharacterized protein YlxW (UPF0749 family)
MVLLAELTGNTLDAAYRRPTESPPPAQPGARLRRSVTLGAVFALAGLVVGTSARQTRDNAPAAKAAQDALMERVHARTAQVDSLQRSLAASRVALDVARTSAATTDSANSATVADVDRLSVLVGVGAVHGPGVKVTVDDAPGVAGTARSTGRIRDVDLQRLLNGLWAAGAEAVAVNGQRLTALTAVRTAGDAILVAYRPLSPPYEVLAIGSPSDLEVEFVDGPGGRWFHTLNERYGIRFKVAPQNDVVVAGTSGVTLRVAERDSHR